jgi:hypothetical protein
VEAVNVLDGADQRARDLIVFADGVEEGGLVEYARRARVVARDLLEALAALEASRSASDALKARCEKQQDLIGRRADELAELRRRQS